MAPILNNDSNLFIFADLEEEQNDDSTELVSMWIKEKDSYIPSTNVNSVKTLDPGIYSVSYSRDQGLFCEKANIKTDELFIFSDAITNDLLNEINLFWDKAEKYKKNNLVHKRGILLEGFPGTGKTSIITLLSTEIIKRGGLVFKVSGFRNLSYYVDFITSKFRKIQPDTPIITILEDIDQYEDVEFELLDFLDGKTHIDHHVIVATTNNTSAIPDTFLRPSRIDLKIEVPLPCDKTREEYFRFKEVPEDDILTLVSKSKNFSLADLKELYISIYLLDYSIDEAVNKISSSREKKKNYLESSVNNSTLGL